MFANLQLYRRSSLANGLHEDIYSDLTVRYKAIEMAGSVTKSLPQRPQEAVQGKVGRP